MTDHELEQRIRAAVEHATPDRLDEILSSCGQQNIVTNTPVCRASTDGQTEGAIIYMSERKNQDFFLQPECLCVCLARKRQAGVKRPEGPFGPGRGTLSPGAHKNSLCMV